MHSTFGLVCDEKPIVIYNSYYSEAVMQYGLTAYIIWAEISIFEQIKHEFLSKSLESI